VLHFKKNMCKKPHITILWWFSWYIGISLYLLCWYFHSRWICPNNKRLGLWYNPLPSWWRHSAHMYTESEVVHYTQYLIVLVMIVIIIVVMTHPLTVSDWFEFKLIELINCHIIIRRAHVSLFDGPTAVNICLI